ncbi:hypothetical protein F4861DRAFT_10792 [Xylaria intraflava]|nr:hypothetical protein F4861DRAFT_10792 [Xylaria intraflava]
MTESVIDSTDYPPRHGMLPIGLGKPHGLFGDDTWNQRPPPFQLLVIPPSSSESGETLPETASSTSVQAPDTESSAQGWDPDPRDSQSQCQRQTARFRRLHRFLRLLITRKRIKQSPTSSIPNQPSEPRHGGQEKDQETGPDDPDKSRASLEPNETAHSIHEAETIISNTTFDDLLSNPEAGRVHPNVRNIYPYSRNEHANQILGLPRSGPR